MNFSAERIWIVGASSGIGAALAHELAGRGASLVVSARRAPDLERLCEALPGKTHQAMPLDISDFAAVARCAQTLGASGAPLNRVICLAAIYKPTKFSQFTISDAQNVFAVNVFGAFSLAQACMDVFLHQKSGQLAICASVAGYVGLPYSQPYAASKAALISFCETLHAEKPPGVDVKLINPGFVETPMTDQNDFPMPMRIGAQEAARCIADGLLSRRFEIHFPKKFTYLMKLLGALPYAAILPILRRMAAS